jgi:hypothetical protein
VPVVKKRAIFVLSLLVSVVAGTGMVGVGKANPYWWYGNVPPDKQTEPPRISVLSPANNTVCSDDNVLLSFEVYVGESKTALDTLLLMVEYETDWQHNNTNRFAPWSSPNPFVHEVNLTGIPEGNHSISFQATERGTYSHARAFNINSSVTIYFTIDANSETKIPEFPAGAILPIFTIASLLIITCKHKLHKNRKTTSIIGD